MVEGRDDFYQKLLATFKIEGEEHVRAMASGLIELEQAPAGESRAGIIEVIFREAHSLKGAARAVNLTEIESLCQSMESVLDALKRREMVPTPELLDLLHQAVDCLEQLLAAAGRPAARIKATAGLCRQLETALKGGMGSQQAPAPRRERLPSPEEEAPLPVSPVERQSVEERAAQETVRIAAAKLNSLLLQAEELLSAKLQAERRAAELREAEAALALWKKEWAKVQPTVHSLQAALEKNGGTPGQTNGLAPPPLGTKTVVEFLEWNHHFIRSLTEQVGSMASAAGREHRSLSGLVDNLLQDMKQILMLPFASLLEIFPKLVRDLSREQGKVMNLVIHGAELEIDRRILEEIKDPLVHLVRNSIDHGIEPPEIRRQQNKPAAGTLSITITQLSGDKVEIEIADDGAGINVAQVRAKVASMGLASAETIDSMSEQEILDFIFQSGVSTSPLITDISGRGLGLAIVREKVEKVGGSFSVETQPGAGTTFRLTLPMTLATFRGLLVQAAKHNFVIPMAYVEHVLRVKQTEVQTVENRATIRWQGQAVSLLRLADVLELPDTGRADDPSRQWPAVILSTDTMHIAFQVDEILGVQEVLVKSLGPQLARVRNIKGATVLGTGQVVPILRGFDLMKSAVRAAAAPARPAVVMKSPDESSGDEPKSILVVEDSITARTLLKNILDGAGYEVKTAVDGIDALATLGTEAVDLVVSDVDMPRLNGLDLTARIRADARLSDIPVILVTALESREDRERGIDVGANAYLVKRSFDQSNLLEVVRRLL